MEKRDTFTARPQTPKPDPFGCMDLSQRKMRMLKVDFFRTPAVRDHIQSDFAHFGVGVVDPSGAAVIQPDMWRRESLHRE